MEVGETVVLVEDVDGMPAGKEGRVMRVRGDILLIGCRSRHRLEFVLARSWEVLPERKWRRLGERAWAGYSAERSRCQTQSYLRIGQRYLRMTQNPL
jgi:hypothetical protein